MDSTACLPLLLVSYNTTSARTAIGSQISCLKIFVNSLFNSNLVHYLQLKADPTYSRADKSALHIFLTNRKNASAEPAMFRSYVRRTRQPPSCPAHKHQNDTGASDA